MPKITVRDTFKDFHTFTGNVYAVEQDGGCKVFERRPDGSSTLRQSFGPHIFGWLKTEQDKPSDIVDAPAPVIDRYTQAGLEGLSGKPPSLNNGDYDINQDNIPDFHTPSGNAAELREKIQEQAETMANDPERPITPPLVSTQKKPPRVRPSRAKPKPDAAAATMAAAVAEGLIPGAPAAEVEEPAPKLDDLLASGLLKKGIAVPDVSHETGIAADLADTVIDPPIREVDVDSELQAAEQKHAQRQHCETCKGRGIVPDPESQDPLDTIICPDC